MGRDRAAYMRDYRARRRNRHAKYDDAKPLLGFLKSKASPEILALYLELVEETARIDADNVRLEAELERIDRGAPPPGYAVETKLAATDAVPLMDVERFNSQPFTGPIPKKK